MSLAQVREPPPVLQLGEQGRSDRLTVRNVDAMHNAAAALASAGPPVLSFDDVEKCDELFVQEAIVDFVSHAWYHRQQVAVAVGVLPGVAEVLDRVLRRSGLVIWSDAGSRPRLLGADQALARSLDAARDAGSFSLAAFRARVLISETAAKNRLTLLARLGAIEPSRDGWRASNRCL